MDLKRGIISIHLGQCGVQIGQSVWELFCLEHDILNSGKIRKRHRNNLDLTSNGTLFEECANGKYVPRAVFFDTEPSVVDVIRMGRKRNLFRPDCLISGKEDAGNVFARGFYTLGDDMRDLVLDRVRKVAECCSGIQGFNIMRSYGGGTGSGFGSALMHVLRDDYPKLTQLEIAVVPSGRYSTAVVEPYNAVFSTHESMLNSDCALFFDNESLYNLMSRRLSIYRPTYQDINRMIAQVISAMTASLRFHSSMKIDLTDVQTNLVPYPRIHFPIASVAPVLPKGYLVHNEKELQCMKITRTLFAKDSYSLMVDPSSGKYMSCCIIYRGNLVPQEINATIHTLRKTRSIQFVDWCPTGFKIGINNAKMIVPQKMPLEQVPRSAIMLANSTSINDFWMVLNKRFDLMNKKRSFWHHYIQEGMPEDDFTEFREDLAALELDYIEVAEDTIDISTDEGFAEGPASVSPLDHITEEPEEPLLPQTQDEPIELKDIPSREEHIASQEENLNDDVSSHLLDDVEEKREPVLEQ